jgi:hypothetical protein
MISLAVFAHTAAAGDYSIVNKSEVIVTSVSVSEYGSGSWNTIVSSARILKGEMISVYLESSSEKCNYELKFIDENGKEYRINDISLCGSNEIVLTTNSSVEAEKIKIYSK